MSFRASLKSLIRRDPAASLRERAADLHSSLARTARGGMAPTDQATPDPALSAVADFHAAWDALAAELNSDKLAGLERAESAAYAHLRAARPTTAAGLRSLADAWAGVLAGERGPMPGHTHADHAADSLIAGTKTCAPSSPRAVPDLVGMLDLGAATMSELDAVYEITGAVVEISNALVWASECGYRKSSGSMPPGGVLMQLLADALADVQYATVQEARRRTPATWLDREKRLSMMAALVISDGNPDRTQAFAQELLAHAEAQRAEH